MPNITFSVDEIIINKVRKIAIDKKTTLTQMLRDYLETVADRDSSLTESKIKKLDQSFGELSRNMGKRQWNRDDLYER